MTRKTVIVTGASKGIGEAIAIKLIKDGSNVVITSRSAAPLRKIQSECPEQVRILVGDMGDASLARQAVHLAVDNFGQLDGLIVNHGRLGG